MSNQLLANRDYFLMSTVYDANSNGAGIKLLDVQAQKIVYVTDTYGHEPYCFSKETLDRISSLSSLSTVTKRIDSVTRIDLLEDIEREFTRIVTPTPSEVPKVRDIIKKELNQETWESRIKYHRNWLYDVQLVPGRKYWWDPETSRFIPSQTSSTGMRIPQAVVENLAQYRGLLEVFQDDFVQEIPEMRVIACDIETDYSAGQIPQPTDPKFPIICICFADSQGKQIALVLERKNISKGSKPDDLPEIQIFYFTEERELLKEAFEILNGYPMIVTFNGDNFDFPYMHERARHLGIRGSSPIIWNRRNKDCNFTHAIHIDTYRFYHNVAIRSYAFGNRYTEESLDAIAEAMLGVGKLSLTTEIAQLSEWELIHYCARDAKITLDLLFFDNRTPLNLIFTLARISRTPLDDLVRTSVSNWVRSMFYSEHRRRKYFIPNPEDIELKKGSIASSQAIIKGKKYKGALVIEPVPGVHFNVAVLDFASLYPSIIGTFNLSYETINCTHTDCRNNKVPQTDYWVCTKKRGVISDIIGFIKDVRVQWLKPESKKKGPHKEFLQILERSLKVLINASYGVLGSDRFQLYCLPVADSTTAYGRDAIERTVSKARELGVTVLYGDTDSVFLLSPTSKQIEEIIQWSQRDLGVGLEMEKTYRYMVLSELKKNYFGVFPDSKVDVKGLMGKKRNTPPFLQDGFREVLKILSQVYSNEEFDEAKERVKKLVRSIYQRLEKRGYTSEDLAVTMQLTMPLDRYKVNSQHVKAARQLEKKQPGRIKAGTLIRFVKTKTGDRVTPVELVTPTTQIDVKAYKTMIDSTFDQLLGALDLSGQELESGQINLMEFFT
ncbi:MAG: DNA-directed DNA polymerase I [Candidatus Thorarchaeota archaeon]